jgi:predicted ABC-type ATPase
LTSLSKTAQIVVIAGVNGSGKSSIAGAAYRAAGGDYFNPDEVTSAFLRHDPSLPKSKANILAWEKGRDLLRTAIENRKNYAVETTLGGSTITGLLLKAANVGLEIRMWYVGLTSVNLHIHRVKERVARGGHDIPEDRIRERYRTSRENLVSLLPHITELRLLDNSVEGNPADGKQPRPRVILHFKRGEIVEACAPEDVPEWAKPIVAATVKLFRGYGV